jgi:cell division protein FtsB
MMKVVALLDHQIMAERAKREQELAGLAAEMAQLRARVDAVAAELARYLNDLRNTGRVGPR